MVRFGTENMSGNEAEAPALKKSKCMMNDTDFKITDEMRKDFSRDGYVIVR